MTARSRPEPPRAAERPGTTVLHGVARADPYAWLKDRNWRWVMRDPAALDPAIRAHLEAENAHAEAVLAPYRELRETLYREMRGRIAEADSSVPDPDGPWLYSVRHVEGGEHPLFRRVPAGGGPASEQVLLDGDREAEGRPYFGVGQCRHGPDHRLAAYSLDLNGSERYRIFVKDIASGRVVDGPIEDAGGGFAWANDGRTLFYTVLDDDHRPCQVRRHAVGADAAQDAVVYDEPDPGFFVGVRKSESGRFAVIDAHDHETSEVRLLDADAPEDPPALVAAREAGLRYETAHVGDRLYILTDADDATDFKIACAPLADPGRASWRDWLPHRPGRHVLKLLAFAGHLVRLEREDGLPRIVVARLADGAEHAIDFDEDAYDLRLVPGFAFATARLRFARSSMTTPEQVFDYDMETRVRTLRKTREVPTGHDPALYVGGRIAATGHDGARIPVSLLRRRDTPLDGTAPMLLYGYGAYGFAVPAAFSTDRLSLVDRGFIYAIAHVRGGADRGQGWYLDGKRGRKANSFADFNAVADRLAACGFTAKGLIAAHGGSAGGMVMGAAANQRPDLFGAVLAEVPFVDVLNTMCDADLPLTPPEWPEWGNPVADEDAWRAIRSYAPYENVAARAYPAILATAGLTDPRVTYWEPAKWVARLRALKTDDRPLLLRTSMEAGHGGASGRFRRLEERAMVYAFALMALGRAGTAG